MVGNQTKIKGDSHTFYKRMPELLIKFVYKNLELPKKEVCNPMFESGVSCARGAANVKKERVQGYRSGSVG